MTLTGNIDIDSEDLISIAEVREALNRRVSYDAIKRWMIDGVAGGGVKLDAIRIGRRYFTTRQALDRFIQSRSTNAVTPPQKAPSAVRRAQTRRRLEDLGL